MIEQDSLLTAAEEELKKRFNKEKADKTRLPSTAAEAPGSDRIDQLVLPDEMRARMPVTKDKYLVRENPHLVQWEREVRKFLRNPRHKFRRKLRLLLLPSLHGLLPRKHQHRHLRKFLRKLRHKPRLRHLPPPKLLLLQLRLRLPNQLNPQILLVMFRARLRAMWWGCQNRPMPVVTVAAVAVAVTVAAEPRKNQSGLLSMWTSRATR